MRLGNEIHKTRIERGASVTVNGRPGRIIDVRPGEAKIEFGFWILKWRRWVPIGEVKL